GGKGKMGLFAGIAAGLLLVGGGAAAFFLKGGGSADAAPANPPVAAATPVATPTPPPSSPPANAAPVAAAPPPVNPATPPSTPPTEVAAAPVNTPPPETPPTAVATPPPPPVETPKPAEAVVAKVERPSSRRTASPRREAPEPRASAPARAERPSSSDSDDDFDELFGTKKSNAGSKPSAARPTAYVPPAPGGGVPDRLQQSDIMSVVLANKPAIVKCVNEQKKKDPSLSGKLVMRWTIQTSGKTAAVSCRTNEFRSTYMASCISGLIKSWSFPRHKRQGEPIDFPFTF
ncbi:AgmX/PglI C-terminal domain-containing protein, partial [Myxococcus vastator]|uniref:AgmX/PglI C-terminal domain-containing protein n=1 Tax=Myxococcus vastator TaxID=2709664 RepID=UPI0013D62901